VTKKLDDASWHYGGDFPSDLPQKASATHIGMFFAWASERGLLDDQADMFELSEVNAAVVARSSSPGEIFIRSCDEKLITDDFTAEGAAFAALYYGNPYYSDLSDVLPENLPSLYHMADSWETFDLLRPVVDQRFDEWKRGVLKVDRK